MLRGRPRLVLLLFASALFVSAPLGAVRAADGAPVWLFDLRDVDPFETGGMFVLGELGGRLIGAAGTAETTGAELWSIPVTGGVGELLIDIEPGEGSGYLGNYFGTPAAMLPGAVVIVGSNESVGTELWRTDGTQAGSFRLPEFAAGGEDGIELGHALGRDRLLFVFENEAYLVADDGAGGRGLWKTDGSAAGTVMVKANVGALACCDGPWAIASGKLFFLAGGMLWITDGTAGGTQSLAAMAPNIADWRIVGAGSRVFIHDSTGTLWTSDGTVVGTHTLKAGTLTLSGVEMFPQIVGGSPTGSVFFESTDSQVWVSDGTELGTEQLTFVDEFTLLRDYRALTTDDGRLFFEASEVATGWELWVSDGTPAGTQIVADLDPGGGDAEPTNLAVLPGGVFFVSDCTPRLTDGTAAGTVALAPAFPYCSLQSTEIAWVVNGIALFEASDPVVGWSLWRSDGTGAGTFLVADLNTDPSSSTQTSGIHFVSDGYAYLNARDALSIFLVRTDGTSLEQVGVTPGKGPQSLPTVGQTERLTPFGAELYFCQVLPGGVHRTDGSKAGTVPLNPPPAASCSSQFTPFAGELYFRQNGSLWKTDGTPGGATEIFVGDGTLLTELAGELYFFFGFDLWKTDGSAGGSVLVAALESPLETSRTFMIECGGRLFFDGWSMAAGTELWSSDGTGPGTSLLLDIYAGGAVFSSSPGSAVCNDGQLYFSARTASEGVELWTSDGTAPGTTLVANLGAGALSGNPQELIVVGNNVFFSADTANGLEVWRYKLNTLLLSEFDLNPGPGDSAPRMFAAFDHLRVGASDGSAGRELWEIPKNLAGAPFMIEIVPGADGSNPSELVNLDDTLWMSACGPEGCEVWSSDGTAPGTQLRADVVAGIMPSNPASFETLGDAVIFTAVDPARGRGIWGMSTTCGDTVVGPAEECDDGNGVSGDGCTPGCEAETVLTLYGEAQGGSITIVVDGVRLVIETTAGETPADVIARIVAAINGHPYLTALRATATGIGPDLTTAGAIESLVFADAGLSDAPIPMVPAVGIGMRLLALLVLCGMGTRRLRR